VSLLHSPPGFDAGWYRPWCLVWLHARRHAGRLAELVQGLPSATLAEKLASVGAGLGTGLDACLAELDAGGADDALLLRTHACLRTLENRHRESLRGWWQQPAIEATDHGRHLLVPPPRRTTRPDAPEQRFPLADDLGVAGVLGLTYRWLLLQAEDELVWSRLRDLHPLRDLGVLRIGLAPLAALDDLRWEIGASAPRGLDHRVPLRCVGTRDAATLWGRVEAVLATAWATGQHVVLMPELVIDADVLARCQAWLAAHNGREPRLRLVVAGSRHCDCGDGFANRCTALDYLGNVLWEQEKRSPFVLEDRATLDRLSPACLVERAFEPTHLGRRLVVADTALGRILTPICLDFIEGDFWGDLGADIYLVPAMTGGLSRFKRRAAELGGRHGAATLVCNARLDGERCHAYRPARPALVQARIEGVELFTVEMELECNNPG
jgi:hypothetical protein